MSGITGYWSTTTRDPEAWQNSVCEGGYRLIAAWVGEEEKTSEDRQWKREVEKVDKVKVAPGATVGS